MKKIHIILVAVVLSLFVIGAGTGLFVINSYFSPAKPDTDDVAVAPPVDKTDDVIFVKPEDVSPTPELPDPTPTPSNPENGDIQTSPVPTPTPNPENYYKNPYITSANTTFVYDKIYSCGKAQQSSNSCNFLILVGDWSSGCTDSIIIVNINEDTGRISTLSIPRDAYVKLPNGNNGKINEIYYSYGISKLCDYIKGFTNIDINYYVAITGDTVGKLIDAVDGIDYNVPVDIPHLGLSKGMQHLNGTQAVNLLRFRNFYYSTDNVTQEQLAWFDGRDINRVKTAIGFIQAFAEQKFTLEYMLNVNSYVKIVLDNADTNIKTETALAMMNILMDHQSKITRDDNINSYYLGGQYNSTKYYNQYGKMWVWEVNDCMVNYNVNRAYYSSDIYGKMFVTKYPGLASF